jgi:Lipid-binding putative hydrolase
MNKIKNNIVSILFGILILTSFTSCDEGGNPDPGKTNTAEFAGDWYITLTDSDGGGIAEHALHSTYNTSANDNTMWIDDHTNGYYLKCKITINQDGTFSAVDSENIIDSGTVTITDGKIIKGGATSLGGHTVDKISFRAHFSYDAVGYDILYDGSKRTGFLEDEY